MSAQPESPAPVTCVPVIRVPVAPAPVTVVVVDDSVTQRRFIRAAVQGDPTLEIVGEARTGREAVAMVEDLRPAAVLMDLHLPVMNGIKAIEQIMATRPTPIVVYSSFVDGEDQANAASAYAAGAVDVMCKPGPADSGRLEEYAGLLCQCIRSASRARVITHPRSRLGTSESTVTTRRLNAAAPVPEPSRHGGFAATDRLRNGAAVASSTGSPLMSFRGLEGRCVEVLAIGASTGGPHALATLLGDLPSYTTASIVVVQHMAEGFMEGLVSWLDAVCPLPVVLGRAGRRLAPGTVTIAPSGLNLFVHERLRVTTQLPDPGQHHVPGVDMTFTSVATAYGAKAVGVLLTGMGRDGAVGLKHMRDVGALTIGQDEATSAVYGMPAAALLADAVDIQLPLPDICAAINVLLASSRAAAEVGGRA